MLSLGDAKHDPTPISVHYTHESAGYSNRSSNSRSFNGRNNSSFSRKPNYVQPGNQYPRGQQSSLVCQFCDKLGHATRNCLTIRHKLNASNPPMVHNTMLSNKTDTNWLVDSATSHHVTSNLNNLSLHNNYNGGDDVLLGDGTGLEIMHTGTTELQHNGSFYGGKTLARPE